MRMRFLPEAESELMDAAHWYRKQAEGLDHEFMRCVDEALARISRAPQLFPLVHGPVRRTLIKRFPYAIFFAQAQGDILVYAVFHTRRNPRRLEKRKKQ
ncbi:MAG: type II toxin-antitoxin system RelE/ParE family toxin [Geoalkalibacter sp.]|jgi:plasmid stabilization system protein ParE|uniref:type II toxin-antitoxin system RelE/ParE family toxin n=1 Tax=Geoalkalibacter sp. TaxID=3041440 RepID=UPI002A9F6851|nr:type II toxin-antitoxin system RelE/ParE family toxin [Thermodesulfobacteriota bacterium]